MTEQHIWRRAPRHIVLARRHPHPAAVAGPFPPRPDEDLVFRGGRTLRNLSFKTFYVGADWSHAPLNASQQSLDAALAAAMFDAPLNDIVGQYFAAPVVTTALPSAVLDVTVQPLYDKTAIHAMAQQVFQSGALSGVDTSTSVINFVLPPGAVLSSAGGNEQAARFHRPPGAPDAEEADSKNGLGGYHGSIHITGAGGDTTIYYAAAVYSDGDNGIPIPGWAPWENICATLYHELIEARTDPDVEDAIRTGDDRFIGWNSNTGQEIGDSPIEEASGDLTQVFQKVPVDSGPGIAPIQFMWPNRVHGPEGPAAAAAAPAAGALRVVKLGA